jgi:Transmembrane exosortase (Exosortase_EpsH)
MSSISESAIRATEDDRTSARAVLVPSLFLIGSQLPLSLVYLLNLYREREHYVFFPVALLVTALIVAMRWPRADQKCFFPGNLSMVLLWTGLTAATAATLLLSPWFGFVALILFVFSLLARTNDRYRFGSLASLALPLIVLVQPPAGIDFDSVQGDIMLMSWINDWASSLASNMVDLLGALMDFTNINLVSGSRLTLPGGSLDTIDIGTRGASVFTLLMATAVYAAVRRRPILRGLLLLGVCVFWAIVGEALNVVICIIGASSFDMEWLNGQEPGWLRFAGLLFSLVMTLLSDSVLGFICGPVDATSIDEDNRVQNWMVQAWNRTVAGSESLTIDKNVRREVAWLERRTSLPGAGTIRLLWIGAIVGLVFSSFQVIELGRATSLTGGHVFSDQNKGWIRIAASLLPETIGNAVRIEHLATEPPRKTAFRRFRNSFVYTFADSPEVRFDVEVSQIWPGWHDTIRDHMCKEWIPSDSQNRYGRSVSAAALRDFPLYEARFGNRNAEENCLFFCQMDAFGEPLECPLTWSDPLDFLGRAGNRALYRIRPRIFVPGSLEISVSVTSVGSVPETTRERALELVVAVINHVQAQIANGELPRASEERPMAPAEDAASDEPK